MQDKPVLDKRAVEGVNVRDEFVPVCEKPDAVGERRREMGVAPVVTGVTARAVACDASPAKLLAVTVEENGSYVSPPLTTGVCVVPELY